MRNIAILLGLSLAACGGDKLDDAISKIDGFKTKMCACTDKKCTEDVFTEYKKFENDVLEKQFSKDEIEKLDKSKLEKAESLEKEMKDCRRKYR
jgi:hypothetical protein